MYFLGGSMNLGADALSRAEGFEAASPLAGKIIACGSSKENPGAGAKSDRGFWHRS
ncbi:hypothetical protein TRIP_B250271 [uncultured Desulfatiglans sp.]|uniref:Uncharacterized protein n=1 Tax=Uncultured Desulfatiglans sp. TaxID=1748965 RepID=A0A653A538_UNCDX|nr:hypothetical protein TRIP_B250271 [uncultured Desulfatiglans sp.]